jgi:diguanylate cyclase (GGDEF)-like protein
MTPELLLVDDNPAMIQLLARMLAGTGRLRFATSGAAALEQLRRAPTDLVLLDAEMPGLSGFDVCTAMKADPVLAEVPVIFVTGHSDTEFELRGLEAGAVDFIAKPVSEPLLLARVRTQLRVKRLTDELRRMASVDALTGVANRRSFDAALLREWQRAQRDATPLALLLVDVDHFKKFNDHRGHPAGDACLQAVAQALQSATLRPADLVARYGGEEFVLLLPQTTVEGAEHIAQRIGEALAGLALPHGASPTAAHVTVSVGVSGHGPGSAPGLLPADLLHCADQALYAAKAGGRARACTQPLVASAAPPPGPSAPAAVQAAPVAA